MGALDILQSAKGTVKNELGNLQSLKHVGRKLNEYEGLVSDLLRNRFVTLAVTIPVDSGSTAAAAAGDSNSGGPADPSWETIEETAGGINGVANSGGDGRAAPEGGEISAGGDELRRDLELIVQGLLRLGEMERVLGVVQERVSEDLKLIIRLVLCFCAQGREKGGVGGEHKRKGAGRARSGPRLSQHPRCLARARVCVCVCRPERKGLPFSFSISFSFSFNFFTSRGATLCLVCSVL